MAGIAGGRLSCLFADVSRLGTCLLGETTEVDKLLSEFSPYYGPVLPCDMNSLQVDIDKQ